MGIYVDRSYRTSLGVSFYDRVHELDELNRLLKMFKTLVVYGPRNVGKSELVRYWLYRERVPAVIVDARLSRDRILFEELGVKLLGIDILSQIARDIVKEVISRIDSMGFASLIMLVAERIPGILKDRRRPLYLFVDEYHMLPRYRSTPLYSKLEVALEDLEALAALLAKDPRYEDIKLILTVSEGFIATSLARQKLLGYSTSWLLIEPMDIQHFTELYNEYRELRGCSLELEELLGLVGAAPGYLSELCKLDRRALIDRVKIWLENLEIALSKAKQLIEVKHEVSPREVIPKAFSILRNGVKPLEDPLGSMLGEILTNYNIVYPKHSEEAIVFKPQLPVYEVALQLAIEENRESLLSLDPYKVYREAIERIAK